MTTKRNAGPCPFVQPLTEVMSSATELLSYLRFPLSACFETQKAERCRDAFHRLRKGLDTFPRLDEGLSARINLFSAALDALGWDGRCPSSFLGLAPGLVDNFDQILRELRGCLPPSPVAPLPVQRVSLRVNPSDASGHQPVGLPRTVLAGAEQPPDTDSLNLNEMESDILEALGDATMTGEKLAEEAGYPPNSNFRKTLSSLVQRNILGNHRRGQGYFRKK